PANKKAYLHLNSDDVIHSFWVPSITGKLDVNPEIENTMYIEDYEEGDYYGKCAELCGPSYSLMDFKLNVVSEEEYDQWVADMHDFDSEELLIDVAAFDGVVLFDDKCCVLSHDTDTHINCD